VKSCREESWRIITLKRNEMIMEHYRGVRDWIESVVDIRLLELESVINAEKGEGLELV
jgi:uncharacterized protein YbcI